MTLTSHDSYSPTQGMRQDGIGCTDLAIHLSLHMHQLPTWQKREMMQGILVFFVSKTRESLLKPILELLADLFSRLVMNVN